MSLYKGYRIEALGTFPMYKVQAQGSGPIPGYLFGTYTSFQQATRAVDRYLASLVKSKRVKQDDSQESAATG